MTPRIAAVAAAGVVSAGVVTGLASGVQRAEAPLPSLRPELAHEIGVDPSSVRELFAAGHGEGRLRLLAAPPSSGRFCLSSDHVRGTSRFTSAFRCLAASPSRRPELVAYGLHAETDEPALRVTFVALARADVTRVVVTIADNRRIALSLHNAAFGTRAVGYAVARRLDIRPPRGNNFARSLTAYRGHLPLATLRIGGCLCPPASVPTLTVSEQERAVALATSDPEVRALVGDRPLRVVPDAGGRPAAAWHTCDQAPGRERRQAALP